MRLILALLSTLIVATASAQNVQYGSAADLCGTRRLFIDAGLYLEGRNNIAAIIQDAGLPELTIVDDPTEADVLIKLTRRGSNNWAQWSVFVLMGTTPRLIDQLADTDENDGLRRFWPSSKIARKFVQLYRTANLSPDCAKKTPEPPTGGSSRAALHAAETPVQRVIDHLRAIDLSTLTPGTDNWKQLDQTRRDVLARTHLLTEPLPKAPLEILLRLGELYELRRDLDFLWFGIEMFASKDTTMRQGLDDLQTKLLETTASVQKAMAERLVDALIGCGTAQP